MGKTFSIKVLFGIYLLLMAGKVFAFSCNVDGGSSIGAGTTSVYVNLDPVILPGQNLVVDLSQHISCWNDYGGWYDTDHINLVQGSAFAGSLQSYKGSLYWNNVTYPFPLTTNTNVLDIGDKTPMPLPLKLYITPVGAAGGVVIKAGEVIARIHMYKIATLGSGNPRNFTWNIISIQGDRTVGITEKPSAEFLARLGERYGFTPPHAPGHAAIASMQAICTGQARALICMGGNFALAMPDREASAVPLTQLDLAVHVATKLNRSHLLTARHSYILPVLGRSEIDMQKSGAQAVTVEDSMSMIHASRGVLKPAGVMLKSECAVVAGIAQAALPQSVVAWEYLVEDYDRIRNDIEAVLPEFADYNQRIRHPGGFHLINAAAERRWMTPSGKANFITSKGLLEDPSSAFNSKLVMATVRSHDQYNTTIYGMDDRYRGVFGQRDVVFMSAKQAKICRVKNGERVNLIALTPDGKRSSRRMDRLKVVIYPMADRSLVTYFPESNHMLTLDNHDPLSGIPGYKSIPVELEPSN